MNNLIQLTKTGLVGLASGYAGQALGKIVVKNYQKDKFNFKLADVAIASVVNHRRDGKSCACHVNQKERINIWSGGIEGNSLGIAKKERR